MAILIAKEPMIKTSEVFDVSMQSVSEFIEINDQLSKEWPNITQKKDALPQADKYKNQKDKFNLLKR